jgi:hypothetical protein
MSGKTFKEAKQIREQIQKALDAGMETPSQVEDWITTHLEKGQTTPTIATISRIMQKELGYVKTQAEYKRGK